MKNGVSCPRCNGRFDAIEAAWCGCLVADRTLVCPACEQCFCELPQEFRRVFWNTAPRALLDRRDAEQATEFRLRIANGNLQLRRPLVLIAEDNRLVLRLATLLVESFGYNVMNAVDGTEALAVSRKLRPDLLMTDARMPGMDGRDVCAALKSDPELSSIAVIVFTSVYTAPSDRVEVLERYKADEFVLKPLKPQRVEELLAKYLGGR